MLLYVHIIIIYNISAARGGGGSFKDKERTGRGMWNSTEPVRDSWDVKLNWSEIQLMWDSSDLRFKWIEIQVIWLLVDLKVKRFGWQESWDSIIDSSVLRINSFESQVICDSSGLRFIGLRFKWFEIQVIADSIILWVWNSTDLKFAALAFNWFETRWLWHSVELKFNWIYIMDLKCNQFDIPFDWNWNAEKSYKNEKLKLKNLAFLRDCLQKWSFETKIRSFCARLPQKWHVDYTLDLRNCISHKMI